MYETDLDKSIASDFLLQFHIGIGIPIAIPVATRNIFSIAIFDAIDSNEIEPKPASLGHSLPRTPPNQLFGSCLRKGMAGTSFLDSYIRVCFQI